MTLATSWKLIAYAPKKTVQAALLAHDEIEDWDFDLVISGREISEDRPLDWVLEGYYPTEPAEAQTKAIQSLFEGDDEFDPDEVKDMRRADIRQCTRDLLLIERAREWLLEDSET